MSRWKVTLYVEVDDDELVAYTNEHHHRVDSVFHDPAEWSLLELRIAMDQDLAMAMVQRSERLQDWRDSWTGPETSHVGYRRRHLDGEPLAPTAPEETA